jgi:hypothetical protein
MTNKLKGGKADGMSIEELAKKHKMDVGLLKIQLEKGIKVEMEEHTKDKDEATEIAMDHLFESPDYYIKLNKMEKKLETKEQTDASCSGSFEGPLSMPILKRDIHKLAEQMDTGVSAGSQYDGPIGTAGPSSPMDKRKKRRKDPLALDEKSKTASITAASTKDMISTKKGFPKFGGPDAKFVEIDARCKTYPYCNQGFDSDGAWKKFDNIKLTEIEGMKEAIEEASKKYGISLKEVVKMIMKEGIEDFMSDPSNQKALKGYAKAVSKDRGFVDDEETFLILTHEPLHIKTHDESKALKLRQLLFDFDIKFKFDKT